MFNKFLSMLATGHPFFSHKEQQKFEIELATRREKVLYHAFFSF